jgi:drug/metabolite transporter (DMT)-like permease
VTDENRNGGRALGYSALATAGSLWGTGFVFGKWALEQLTVGQMVFLRFLFASLGLLPVIWYESRHSSIRIRGGDLTLIVAAATIGVPIQFIIQFEGLARTTVSHASLMVGILPVLLAAGAAVFSRERLDAIGWLGLLASVVGAGLVAAGAAGGGGNAAQGPTLSGDLFVVSSLVAAVAWILMSQALMRRGYSPVMTSAVVIITGTILLAGWVAATDGMPAFGQLSLETWGSVAAMGILATATTTLLWNWGLQQVPASQAGVFVNLEPVVGAILGVILFHEAMGVFAIVGGLLILGAAVVVSRRNPA